MLLEKYFDYRSASEEILSNYLLSNREKYNKIFSCLDNMYMLFNFLVDEENILEVKSSERPIAIQFTKTVLSTQGIYQCLYNGVPIEASILLRSLFETYVDLKIILRKDSIERMRLWSTYKFVIRKKQLDKNLELLEKGEITVKSFEEIYPLNKVSQAFEEFDEVKDQFNDGKCSHWAWSVFSEKANAENRRVSIKYICEQLGLLTDYVRIYSTFSITTHSDSLIENIIGERGYCTPAPIFNDHTYRLGGLAILYIGKIIEEIADYLEYKNQNELKEIIATWSLPCFN